MGNSTLSLRMNRTKPKSASFPGEIFIDRLTALRICSNKTLASLYPLPSPNGGTMLIIMLRTFENSSSSLHWLQHNILFLKSYLWNGCCTHDQWPANFQCTSLCNACRGVSGYSPWRENHWLHPCPPIAVHTHEV